MKVLLTSAVRNTGMATIRGLARCGVNVVGADDRRLPFNCRSRYLRRLYLHAPVADERRFVKSNLAIIAKEQPDIFFPIEGTHLVAAQAALFEAHTHLLVPPHASYRTADDNRSTLELCRKLDIDCPRLFNPEDAEKFLLKSSRARLVVKPRRDIGAGRGVWYVDNFRALIAARSAVEAHWGDSIIQEYIPGGTANMRTVNLLFDRNSRLLAYFTTRKIRQWPTSGGITAMSISTREAALVDKILPIFKILDWRGLAEVELKIDERDGKTKLIEINPRVWGYFGFPISCGVNFPLLYCHAALDHFPTSTSIGEYRVGMRYINPTAYVKAALSDFFRPDRKKGRLRRLTRELRGPMVGNGLEWKDGPVIAAKILYEILTKRSASYASRLNPSALNWSGDKTRDV